MGYIDGYQMCPVYSFKMNKNHYENIYHPIKEIVTSGGFLLPTTQIVTIE